MSAREAGGIRVRRALLSASDRTGLSAFARGLAGLGVELVATSGTAAALREDGLAPREVSALTGFPEMLGGRVRTLHPAIHAGILYRRGDPSDEDTLRAQGIGGIDLVAVTLYPFEDALRGGAAGEALAEMIDIGGPALLRAAAKNHAHVVALTSPEDYAAVLEEMERTDGSVARETARRLAIAAFARTAAYDLAVATGLDGDREAGGRTWPPAVAGLVGTAPRALRYGENPHQRGALFAEHGAERALERETSERGTGERGAERETSERGAGEQTMKHGTGGRGWARARALSGKPLSYTNILDLEAAATAVAELDGPAAVIVKHGTPCGAAEAESLSEAYTRALAGDPVSAYGCVAAVNRAVDTETAAAINATPFLEALAAPGFAPEAFAALRNTKTRRFVEVPPDLVDSAAWSGPTIRALRGGFLLQDRDRHAIDADALRTVTARGPSDEEIRDLLFAWRVVRQARSNACVLARDRATVGIGAGTTNRVDAVWLAARRAGERARGAVLASDGFFPLADGVEAAATAGVTAIIQPGGSIRDGEAIAAADRAGLSMVFTGVRCFAH